MFKRSKTPPPDQHRPMGYEWLALEQQAPREPGAPTAVAERRPASPPAGRAVYEIPDFAKLTDEDVYALKQQAAADIESGLVGCAHLVFTRDLGTGIVNHHVPCSNGSEALLLAVRVVAEKRAERPKRRFTVTVTPLLPH